MAKMTIKGMDEMSKKLNQLGNKSVEISKKAVAEGAGIVADEIRKNLKKNLAGSDYSKGDLLDSLGIAPIDIDENGDVNTKIDFDGYDKKGIPNALKARAMESGTSKQKKKPFVRPAVKASKEKAEQAMAKVIDSEIENLMK